ncbi:hypothetical protein VNO77_07757 [Canavalia gladiata]|uniref:TIR domain-containing protein n=1 Tax=Canavalia gladiata TaxID=3824 RepID=A0AAN9QVZ6_CANGL
MNALKGRRHDAKVTSKPSDVEVATSRLNKLIGLIRRSRAKKLHSLIISFHLSSVPSGNMESESGSNPEPNWIHDVFLSFCREDTRVSFVPYLYAALANAGVSVYWHQDMLIRDVADPLSSIQESRICIIVFSEMYAQSIRCLEQLKQIMEYRRTQGLMIVPVFYEIEPSDVRRQTGTFGKAFEDLTDKVMSWRASLREASNISGFVFTNR